MWKYVFIPKYLKMSEINLIQFEIEWSKSYTFLKNISLQSNMYLQENPFPSDQIVTTINSLLRATSAMCEQFENSRGRCKRSWLKSSSHVGYYDTYYDFTWDFLWRDYIIYPLSTWFDILI